MSEQESLKNYEILNTISLKYDKKKSPYDYLETSMELTHKNINLSKDKLGVFSETSKNPKKRGGKSGGKIQVFIL